MSAHTPGPWTLGSRVVSADTHDTFNVAVALLSSAREAPELSRDERAANGRLIAAAPDLLAACERVIDALKDHVLIAASLDGARTQGREICSLLNAAIAKARGE